MADVVRSYAVILEPEPQGGFTVIIPALPEAHTQGETVEECLANAREVIELVLEVRAERGEEIPPSDIGACRHPRGATARLNNEGFRFSIQAGSLECCRPTG